MRALWEKEGESRGEKAIRAGVPLAGKVSPFPASFPFGKEHPFHVGVGEARVGGKFDVPGTADDAEGAFGRAFLGRIAQRAGTGGIAEHCDPVGKFFGDEPDPKISCKRERNFKG